MAMVTIPSEFLSIPYDGERHPQAVTFDPSKGANCQLFAYAVLRHFRITVPHCRSGELWEDEEYTVKVEQLESLDLLLLNPTSDSWGAHVAVYLGDTQLIHLSKAIGVPAITSLEELQRIPRYLTLVGAKRVKPIVR
jgi:cell wall-associated NlpC family hydrolase